MFTHLGQCHLAQYLLPADGHLPAPQVPCRFPCLLALSRPRSHSPQIPGRKTAGSLSASSPTPLCVFHPSAPFSTLSPRHQLPSLGPWDFPSFDRSAVPHCLPARSSFLHLGVGSCLPTCFPCLDSPSPEGSPLALCRYEFHHDRRLSSRHHLPLLPAIPEAFSGNPVPCLLFSKRSSQSQTRRCGALLGHSRELPGRFYGWQRSPSWRLSPCSLVCPQGAWPTPRRDPAILLAPCCQPRC